MRAPRDDHRDPTASQGLFHHTSVIVLRMGAVGPEPLIKGRQGGRMAAFPWRCVAGNVRSDLHQPQGLCQSRIL